MPNADDDSNKTYSHSAARGRHHRFRGYIPDLLQELADIIHFDYDMQPVPDGSFGHRRLNGTWDGMVGQLIDRVSQPCHIALFLPVCGRHVCSAKRVLTIVKTSVCPCYCSSITLRFYQNRTWKLRS